MKFSCSVNDRRHSNVLVFIDCDFIMKLADLSGVFYELSICTAWLRYGDNGTFQFRNKLKIPLLGKLNCGRVKWVKKIYLLLTLEWFTESGNTHLWKCGNLYNKSHFFSEIFPFRTVSLICRYKNVWTDQEPIWCWFDFWFTYSCWAGTIHWCFFWCLFGKCTVYPRI